MGPEVEAAGILIEDSNLTEMLAIYRRNPAAQDDEDCIYILDSGGRPVTVRRTVFGICDDDAFDCLAGTDAAMQFVIDSEGAHRVMLGTNFAGWDQEDDIVDRVSALALSDAQRTAVLGATARDWFRLPV